MRRGRRADVGIGPYGEVISSAAEQADRSVRPYAAIRGVVRDRVGQPQGSPLRKRYKRCSARQAGDRKGRPYGGLQEVRWGGQTRGRPPLRKCVVGWGKAHPLRTPCYAIPQKKRHPREALRKEVASFGFCNQPE